MWYTCSWLVLAVVVNLMWSPSFRAQKDRRVSFCNTIVVKWVCTMCRSVQKVLLKTYVHLLASFLGSLACKHCKLGESLVRIFSHMSMAYLKKGQKFRTKTHCFAYCLTNWHACLVCMIFTSCLIHTYVHVVSYSDICFFAVLSAWICPYPI